MGPTMLSFVQFKGDRNISVIYPIFIDFTIAIGVEKTNECERINIQCESCHFQEKVYA